MRTTCIAVLGAAVAFCAAAPVAHAQAPDTLRLGDRVRIRIVSAPGTVNTVTGNVQSLSPDTLTVGLPGSRGTVVLPRLSIAQLGVSDGVESRVNQIVRAAPLLLTVPITVAVLARTPQSNNNLRVLNYGFIGMEGYLVTRILSRPRLERFRSMTSWLDGR